MTTTNETHALNSKALKALAAKRRAVRKELIERLRDLAHSATLRAAQVELGMGNEEDYVRKAATIDHLSKLLSFLSTPVLDDHSDDA